MDGCTAHAPLRTPHAMTRSESSIFAPRFRRPLFIGLAVLVGLPVIALALAGPALKPWAVRELGALLGRTVALDRLFIQPLGLQLEVEGLSVAGPDNPAEPPLALRRLVVDVAVWRSLWHRAPVIEGVHLDGLALAVSRSAQGELDWQDVIDRLAVPPDRPPAGEAPEARWAVEGIQFRDVALRWHDAARGLSHQVTGLSLDLPGLRSLDDASRLAPVQATLAMSVDAAPLRLTVQGQPLAPASAERQAELTLDWQGVDLGPVQAYLPTELGVGALSGRLDARLSGQLRWAAGAELSQPAPESVLRGQLSLADLRVADPQGEERLRLSSLALGLEAVEPLARRVALGPVELTGLSVALHRQADGRWSGMPLQAPTATTPAPAAAGPAWQVSVARWQARDWTLAWRDERVHPASRMTLKLAQMAGEHWQWPLKDGAPTASGVLQGALQDASTRQAGQFELRADWGARSAEVRLDLSGLTLAPWRAYARAAGWPDVEAEVDLTAQARWNDAPTASLPRIRVDSAEVRRLRVPAVAASAPAATDLLAWQRLRVEGVTLDPAARAVEIARLRLEQPRLQARRDRDGVIDLVAVLPAAPPATAAAASAAPAGPPWRVALGEFQLQQGRVRWLDQSRPEDPVQLALDRWNLKLGDLRWPPERGRTSRLQGSLQVVGADPDHRGAAESGQVSWNGQLGLAPMGWRGALQVNRLPLHDLAGLLDEPPPVRLRRADLGWRGQVLARLDEAGPTIQLQGQARLDDLQVRSRRDTEGVDLLAWHSLAVGELGLALSPGQKPRVRVADAVLTDLDARLLVTEQGQLNLNDLAAKPAAAPPRAEAAAAVPAAASSPAAGPGLPVDLDLGGLRLVNGHVDFTDRFIRPNYSAALSQLNGQVGAFRSGTAGLAAVSLDGRVAGTGQLSIQGAFNPTAHPLELDLQARATDLELAPLSPYAGKYAGYAIKRGKMSLDVGYRIQADGQLQASNRLVLNQLTFGERVDSPDALGLPVTLAVALLKDRHGVIDLNLPIGGSLNDPQFSIGALVWQVVRNVVVKAVTAPFSLLFGGSEKQASQVAFQPGRTHWRADAEAALDRVAQALKDRPGLQMTVTGVADPQSERVAMQQAWLEDRLQAELRKERLRVAPATAMASSPAGATPPDPTLTDADRARLLPRLYADQPSDGKPRNALGLLRSLTPVEMTAWLLARVPVNTDTARELALQRGVAVREALMARGVPLERLFLAAPKLRASDDSDAEWQPQVSLALELP